jgi:1,2-diacylglycerol-3-alpha-glucose alpha-1,2-glucosyltransferase
VKVCVYFEHEFILSSAWSSGIRQAYRNHTRALTAAGVTVTNDPNDSFDVLHLETLGPRSARLADRYRGVRPVVIHGHTTAQDFANSFVMSDALAPHLGRLFTWFYNKADLVVAPTDYARRVLRRQGVTCPIDVITNGVDVRRFTSLRRARSLGRGRHFLKGTVAFAVGLVLLRKGVDVFCEVARRLPEITFVWFGPVHRAVKPQTMRIIQDAPPNVRFTGFVEDITEAYGAGDIFFFPSAVENEGIAVLEAAAAGRPIVLRDAECFADRFVNEHNCLLAPDADALADGLARLAADADLRARLGAAARAFAEAHSLDRVGTRLRDLYGRLAERVA